MLRKPLLLASALLALTAGSSSASEQIVQLTPGARPSATLDGAVSRSLPLIGGVVADLSAGEVAALRHDPAVRAVTPNRSVQTHSRSPRGDAKERGSLSASFDQAIRATDAWDDGIDGSGVGVAVLDTGIQGDLADFGGRVIASAVVNPAATTAGDRYGHGTHVAGLVAGDAPGHRGVAPGADLVSVKVSDDHGNVSLADVIAGLQFVADHRDALNIRVVNLSLNSTDAEPAATDPLDAAVEALWFDGVVVVGAAGNRGSTADAVSYAPANDPFTIAVGATDDQGTKRTSDDMVADWSSRGRTQAGLRKPDVLAPGAHMVSVLSPGSDFAQQCPQCVRDGRWFQVGGTSMASGVVTGAAALVLDAHPDWTPDQVKGALMGTLRDGIVDVAAAIKLKARKIDDVNAGATPSTLFDTTDAGADWSRISWSAVSWSRAKGDLAAGWSRISWSCGCAAAQGDAGAAVDPSRISSSRISWSRISWSRISWSRISWSASFAK